MKLSNIQIFSILALLGFINNNATAADGLQVPEEVQSQINFMLESGLITIDPATNKPLVRIDVLRRLKEEGRIDSATVGVPDICGGTDGF